MSGNQVPLEDKELEAIRVYLARKMGIFMLGAGARDYKDKAGRWYPDEDERADCCDYIRGPTRSYPWSFYIHCHTAKHIATSYGVETAALKTENIFNRAPLLLGLHPSLDKVLQYLLTTGRLPKSRKDY